MMYFGSYMLQDKKLRLGSAAQRIQMALVIFSLSSSTFRSSRGHGHHMVHVVVSFKNVSSCRCVLWFAGILAG